MATTLGPRRVVVDEGPERHTRLAVLRSGAGLDVAIDLDHGMGLRHASIGGVPVELSLAADGDAGADWLRRWRGGLLTTCGLRNVGPAGELDGERFGQHGRASSLAAESIEAVAEWDGDRLVSRVSGTMHEAVPGGEHLSWRRTWRLAAGENRIALHDVVRNDGFRPEALMLLYHVNVGWPFLDEGVGVEVGGVRQEPFEMPEPGADEQMVRHAVAPGADGWCRASVHAATTFTLEWRPDELPWFTEWRWPRAGTYALAFEPGTCLPYGRRHEAAAGRTVVLAPGEEKHTRLVLRFDP